MVQNSNFNTSYLVDFFSSDYPCVSNKRAVANKHPGLNFALKKNKRPVSNKCPGLNII